MNGILTSYSLDVIAMPLVMPRKLNYSSDSIVDESDKIAQQIVDEKFILLKKNIGEELFNQLSYSDRILMAKTAGVIDFGHPIDLNNIENEIESYDYSK